MTTHTQKFQFLHTAIKDLCWLIQQAYSLVATGYCFIAVEISTPVLSYHSHPSPSPPSSIVIATKLQSLEPRTAAGAILCINRESLSRGISKPSSSSKGSPHYSVIACLNWSNWHVYNWPCWQWRFSDILGLPSPSLPWWKLWNPKGTAEIKGKSSLPIPHVAMVFGGPQHHI